jgi:hypothetical protein
MMTLRFSALALVLVPGIPALSQEILSASSGPFSLDWKTTDIEVRSKGSPAPVLSFRNTARVSWDRIAKDAAGQSISGEMTYRVLSFVGPLLSVETATYCDCGGAHPIARKSFDAIDLTASTGRKHQLASLNKLFPEAALLAALKADKLVSKALQETQAPPPANLSALVAALKFQPLQVGDCNYTFGENFLSHFAIYDTTANGVAVRIGLSHDAEVCRGQLTQIGLLLPVPETLKADLSAAKAKTAGFLMIDSPRLAKEKETVFHFSTKGKSAK